MQTRAIVTAVGGAGTSVGAVATETVLRGYIEAITVLYSGAPVTTTVTITENDNYGFGRTVLALPAGNTNAVYYPRAAAVTTIGGAVANSWAQLWIPGYSLNVAVAAANSGSIITVVVVLSPGDREY